MSRALRGRRVLVVAGAVLALAVAGTPAPAQAAAGGPARASLFCDLFPLLCPPDGGTPDPAPAPTPSPGPGGGPSPAPTPAPSADPGDPGDPAPADPGAGGGGQDGAQDGAAGDEEPAATVDAACDLDLMPDGRIGLGTDEAQQAAEAIAACRDAQAAAEEAAQAAGEDVPAPAVTRAGGLPTVSSIPVTLTASRQTLTGVAYDGIVTVQTADGPLRVLKLRADSVRIEGFRQEVPIPVGSYVVRTDRTVEVTGNVELYVLSQTGKAFGILPLPISVDSPPPLVPPFLVFTDVEAKIAFLKADRLSVPDARLSAGA